jgi:hypothetical protein
VTIPWRPLVLLLLVLSPTLVLAVLLADPPRNTSLFIPVEHFVITTNVSVVALLVAIFVARAALGAGHYRSLLVAVGFLCMAGIFMVHGLSTPDVLQRGDKRDDAGLVVGVSAQIALWTSALFFAIRYTPAASFLERHVPPRALLAGVIAAIGAYAVVAIGWPAALGGLARWILVGGGAYASYDPSAYGTPGYTPPDILGGAGLIPYLVSGSTVAFNGIAAWAQGRDYRARGEAVARTGGLRDERLPARDGPVGDRCRWDPRQVHRRRADGDLRRDGRSRPRRTRRSPRRARDPREHPGDSTPSAHAPESRSCNSASAMHTGDVVLGAIGLPERSDYTAIGDTVNTASRMETLTKEYKVDAVLSGATAGHLRDDGVELRSLGETVVRGKSETLSIFTLD